MNKARITLALFVIAMLGGSVVRFAAGPARADGGVNKVTTSPENSFPVASAPKTVTSGPLNPFPALNAVMVGGAAQSSNQEGYCDLNPINRSGIQALIQVEKVGQTQTITGFGIGFDPSKAYVSLFYDAGSPGSGPCACVPSNPPPEALQTTCKTTTAPAVNFSQMVIGYWLPLTGSSKRELKVLKSGAEDAPVPLAFVSLENIGAISVREDTKLGQPLSAAPDPARFQLRACGKFRLDKDQVASR